jgi:hypothetical protein
MGYEGERAGDVSLKRLTESAQVKKRLAEMKPVAKKPTVLLSPVGVAPSDWLPKYVVGVDGSWHTLPVEQGLPGAEVSFHSVASVLLKISDLAQLDKNRPIHPAKFRSTRETEAFNIVLSGTNFARTGQSSPREAFRSFLYESLAESGLLPDEESLLATYEHLLGYRTESRTTQCPYKSDCGDPDRPFDVGSGVYACQCAKKLPIYSTDALDIHSSLRETGSSGRMFGEAQEVIEHLWLLNVIRAFIRNKGTATIDEMAFVMDGPLRIDGEPAWLSWSIRDDLMKLNAEHKARGGKDLLILGIEKTGNFIEHFKQLDVTATGTPDRLRPGTLYLLDNEYIRENIAYGPTDSLYGKQTYYGRKFFYKTKTKALICGHVPFLNKDGLDRSRAEPSQYPRLADILSILDRLGSARYPNAIIPVIAAHAEASIPLIQGRKILEMLAKENLPARSA